MFEILDARGAVTVCPLHGEALREDLVPCVGGLPWYGEEAPATFLYANTELWIGSCVPGPEMVARVRYCPTCRERKAAYLDDLRNRGE
jgi:hypothetical protein